MREKAVHQKTYPQKNVQRGGAPLRVEKNPAAVACTKKRLMNPDFGLEEEAITASNQAFYTVAILPNPTSGMRLSTVLLTISESTVAPPSMSMSSSRPSARLHLRRIRSGRM